MEATRALLKYRSLFQSIRLAAHRPPLKLPRLRPLTQHARQLYLAPSRKPLVSTTSCLPRTSIRKNSSCSDTSTSVPASQSSEQDSKGAQETPANSSWVDNPASVPASQNAEEDAGTVQQTPAYELTFTCKPCKHRSTHRISKQGYYHGSVLITCPSCSNRHVITDHLKIFSDKSVTLEDILREKGQQLKKGVVGGANGDVEFWDDGTETHKPLKQSPGLDSRRY